MKLWYPVIIFRIWYSFSVQYNGCDRKTSAKTTTRTLIESLEQNNNSYTDNVKWINKIAHQQWVDTVDIYGIVKVGRITYI